MVMDKCPCSFCSGWGKANEEIIYAPIGMVLHDSRRPTNYSSTGYLDERYWGKDPLESITLHAAQREIYNSQAQIRIVVRGRRFGSTTLGYRVMRDFVELHARAQAVWISSDAYMAYRAFKRILKGHVRYDDRDLHFELPNGTTLHFYDYDMEGVEPRTEEFPIDFLMADDAERMTQELWQSLCYSFQTGRGRVLLCGSANLEHGDCFKHLYEHAEHFGGIWHRFYEPTASNPHITMEDIRRAKRDLSPQQFEIDYRARWVQTIEDKRIIRATSSDEALEHVFRGIAGSNKRVLWIVPKASRYSYACTLIKNRLSHYTALINHGCNRAYFSNGSEIILISALDLATHLRGLQVDLVVVEGELEDRVIREVIRPVLRPEEKRDGRNS